MNFITFEAATTNIFPASNTTTGGQLVTEFNLRSRETVATDPNIVYSVGPSYTHGEKDFEVSLLSDGGGIVVSSSILSIAEGRAVINGHYVENLAPMTIDLAEANADLQAKSMPLLKGELSVGIRALYATEETIAGSIKVEGKEGKEKDMFVGIQMVVLPKDEMITPSDSPLDPSKVTAHIVLANFVYLNNVVTSIQNLTSKMQYLTSDRIKNLDSIVSNKYVTKTGLNSKKLYAFAGKGVDPSTGRDTWEDVTDSLMVWDHLPVRTKDKPPFKEATLLTGPELESYVARENLDGLYLIVPHKQVSGMTEDNGVTDEYYAPRILEFPQANYSSASPGVVTKEYTHQIQTLAERVREMQQTKRGKQVMFMETRTITTPLPEINSAWDIGDYVLVKNDDFLMGGEISSTESSPATMYVILPGEVMTIQFITKVHGNASVEPAIPGNIKGAEINYQDWYESSGQSAPDTTNPDYYPTFFDTSYPPRAIPYDPGTNTYEDYFRIRYYLKNDDEQYPGEYYPFDDYYYGVKTSGPRAWSDALLVTGSMYLATESTIGGFYNSAETATDQGYVRVDDTGHLKLIDYELLRSGTLAYQLSNEVSIPEGSSITEIQTYINEYINQRIAFPVGNMYAVSPYVVDLYIPITGDDDGGVLEIYGIDSRFNTAVCLHILGDARTNVTINIRDCQKFMIDPNIKGTPVINVFRTCLRYDAEVFQYIRTCPRDYETYGTFTGMLDISLWYERLESTDPNLTVNDMTVMELDSHIMIADINYWKELDTPIINDNDYLVALKSITFSGVGDIVGCSILVANNSTDNIVVGEKIIVGETSLPQGSSLIYPTACLTRMLKVDGTFVSGYYSEGNWCVTDTTFTFLSGVYDETSTQDVILGQVAFHSRTSLVPQSLSQRSIAGWEPDSYHVFQGGTIN